MEKISSRIWQMEKLEPPTCHVSRKLNIYIILQNAAFYSRSDSLAYLTLLCVLKYSKLHAAVYLNPNM
jgi:hypothetical protein